MDRSEKIVAILGLTEAIKQYGIPSKFAPTVAIIIGILISYIENPTKEGILEGLILGGTVTGGYALTKKAGQGIIAPFTEKPVETKPAPTPSAPTLDYSKLEADDDRGV